MNVENQTVEQQEKIGMTDRDDCNELQPSCMRAFAVDHSSDRDDEISVEYKVDSVEWTTELLPPIGAKCRYFVANPSDFSSENHMREMTCVAHVGGLDGLINNGLAVLVSNDFSFSTVCNDAWIRKLETPEKKKEREELESAYDLYLTAMNANYEEPKSFEHFRKFEYKQGWIAVVNKTDYRK